MLGRNRNNNVLFSSCPAVGYQQHYRREGRPGPAEPTPLGWKEVGLECCCVEVCIPCRCAVLRLGLDLGSQARVWQLLKLSLSSPRVSVELVFRLTVPYAPLYLTPSISWPPNRGKTNGLGIVTLPHSIALPVAARIFGSEPRLGLQVVFRVCTLSFLLMSVPASAPTKRTSSVADLTSHGGVPKKPRGSVPPLERYRATPPPETADVDSAVFQPEPPTMSQTQTTKPLRGRRRFMADLEELKSTKLSLHGHRVNSA